MISSGYYSRSSHERNPCHPLPGENRETDMAKEPPIKALMTAALLTALTVFAAGCAPVISDDVLKGADRNLTYEEVVAEPARYTGETVVFGGTVLEVENEEGLTRVYVLQQPLSWRLRPRVSDPSGGRFIAEYDGFVDPAVYGKGREITVAGVVRKFRSGIIGKMPYYYPVIEVTEDHLWSYRDGGPRVGVGLGVIFGN